MFELIKGLHNLLRWIVVFGGVYALWTSLRGLISGGVWAPTDRRAGLIFTSSLNVQLVLGIVVYLFSPLVRGAFGNMGAAMQDDHLRFFAVEHLVIMLLAVVSAQLGYSLARRAPTDRAKFVRSSIGYLIAALLLVYGIPWGRSLIPWA
ncbi:MAG: hypothetical protein JSV66_11125 [Trueperaceae bacterium]|nr:MAG: hypothetical protein JSV66_11125 [Trueperaceae bacterium]